MSVMRAPSSPLQNASPLPSTHTYDDDDTAAPFASFVSTRMTYSPGCLGTMRSVPAPLAGISMSRDMIGSCFVVQVE